jgi:hypothetical protein
MPREWMASSARAIWRVRRSAARGVSPSWMRPASVPEGRNSMAM